MYMFNSIYMYTSANVNTLLSTGLALLKYTCINCMLLVILNAQLCVWVHNNFLPYLEFLT